MRASPVESINALYALMKTHKIGRAQWRDLWFMNVAFIAALRDAGFTIADGRLNDAIHCNMEMQRIMRERKLPLPRSWW